MIVAGRYEILSPLGAGGEARVFRARDAVLETEVALRLADGQEASNLSSRLPDAGHPHWVRLLDRGRDAAHGDYSVFELLHGQTLGDLRAHGPLDADALPCFIGQSLEAVGALHDAGWTHGDLNENNFLLHEGSTWKLLELPFHRASGRPAPPLFGSIYTLAPEQIDGQPADARSDLYALGCLYYAAACGTYPHSGGTEADIAIGRLRFPAQPLRELAPTIPEYLAKIVMLLLARRPEDRPPGIAAVRALFDSADDPSAAPRSE